MLSFIKRIAFLKIGRYNNINAKKTKSLPGETYAI
jgi:hypothetical protein